MNIFHTDFTVNVKNQESRRAGIRIVLIISPDMGGMDEEDVNSMMRGFM